MIESFYWKEDLKLYARKFKPLAKPPRYSEKRQVNFEKDVIISLFMVRKLSESLKLSLKTTQSQFTVYSSKCKNPVNNNNFWDIGNLYDLENEEKKTKNVQFISNQLIHGQATYAYRGKDRNWEGIYTCSDFERSKNIYRIPIATIIEILEVAADDYPSMIYSVYCPKKKDFVVKTN